MMDLFQEKRIAPMLIAENVPTFADPEWLYELKWDGERCVAYLDPGEGTELRNKRNMKMLPKVPELSNLHHQVKKRCILDGELLCIVNGKPDFETIQRRSLMSNPFKIEMESRRFPACFVAFDCLYYDGRDITKIPLTERKKYLDRIAESERLAVSKVFDYHQAKRLFSLAREQGLEGMVAKRKESLYYQGKRTKDWLKIKNLQDDDFVVCGWIPKQNHMTSIVLGQYRQGRLVYKGHVTLGVGGEAFAAIKKQKIISHPPMEVPEGHENENARWLKPELVCVVQYMYKTEKGSMRQPVFKGLRRDKLAEDCVESD